ncbi:TetR/AcrR family transcriptional regulator [Celeribacter naphthalenivorans]|uniref:TetR/AcrR family transcriptional regulator n=1 Tax=Celeribacter naphthalenivorans TaxID=1614694 RepID=UPI001CFA5245|nr:TetR/AcrR family transcriptional regulator [Celeribacter naphthalenivorans]
MAKTSRREIIASARDLMREKGYAGMSMKDVALSVGLSKSSLYSHFGSKEDLVPEVLDLTFGEIIEGLEATGDWRADYEAALDRLSSVLIRNRRCLGLHLAYGLSEDESDVREAVSSFFLDLREFLRDLLMQGLDVTLAEPLALDTLTAVEGATLWLALYGNAEPMERVRRALLARADGLLGPEPDEQAKALLTQMLGDWRAATAVERRLADRVIAAQSDLLT